ncbi:MAG: flavodoxin family protein [Candidatus Acetothermia bacterium]|jgi:multimeric flavodoxin WrbA|nr:flavodoxin family protein [Candidatus Acetothermia bacterium]
MYVLGIVGSMRKAGNTNRLVAAVLAAAKEANPRIRTEVVHLADLDIGPCEACYDVCGKVPYRCVVEDDFQELLQTLKEADGLVLGSPLYYPVPSRLIAVTERLACLAYFHDMRGHTEPHPLEGKPCALAAVTGGSEPLEVLRYLFGFALSARMTPVAVKRYPYYGAGGKGDLDEDTDLQPFETAKVLGRLLAEAVAH